MGGPQTFGSITNKVTQHIRELLTFAASKGLAFTYRPKFSGWGMTTRQEPPWNDEFDWASFRQTCSDVKHNFEFGSGTIGIDAGNVDSLKWRHWIVSYATRQVCRFARTNQYEFVECGVADGMSAFFALREIRAESKLQKSTFHLYDSWKAMRKESLSGSEQKMVGHYSDLDLARTKKNLEEFKGNIIYHVGYIPESFQTESPESIAYLHIDLNSAKATLETLRYFYPRLVDRGGILFDDYGFDGFVETKRVIDGFIHDKPGILEKSPTGQAMYYHSK